VDFKFAAAVAAFGMALRDSPYKGDLTPEGLLALARSGLGPDRLGYRAELVGLVESALPLLAERR
jgi:Ca-activated chloride channel family protein